MGKKLEWGVVRYPRGRRPGTEFDGWYAKKEDADGVFQFWRDQYPTWIVALVRSVKTDFPARNFKN